MFLAGQIVAMVTHCATKLTATCSPMIGQFVENMILALTGIEWLYSKSWKVLKTVFSHLKEIREA